MLKINREWSERENNCEKLAFGAYKIICPRPLGGGGAPPGSASVNPIENRLKSSKNNYLIRRITNQKDIR